MKTLFHSLTLLLTGAVAPIAWTDSPLVYKGVVHKGVLKG